jgi:hypothetical protein
VHGNHQNHFLFNQFPSRISWGGPHYPFPPEPQLTLRSDFKSLLTSINQLVAVMNFVVPTGPHSPKGHCSLSDYRLDDGGEAEVTLRPTISQPVRLGVRRPSGTRDQFFILLEIFFYTVAVCYFVASCLTRGRVCNLLLLLVIVSPVPLDGGESKSKSHYDRQSVGQSVMVSGAHLGPATNLSFSSRFSFRQLLFVIL